MFGQNPVLKQDLSTARTLQVVSIFRTVQGEGPHAGVPAIFIRLHGCNLRCHFCDTEFSNPDDPYLSVVSEIIPQVKKLAGEVSFPPIKLVVITGGEPFRQDISLLCKRLIDIGMLVQIETAGTLWVPAMQGVSADIVISPKTPKINDNVILRRSVYFKYVISATDEVHTGNGLPMSSAQMKGVVTGIAHPPLAFPRQRIFLSPMDEQDEAKNARNRKLVADLAIRYGYRAGLQLHKYFDVE